MDPIGTGSTFDTLISIIMDGFLTEFKSDRVFWAMIFVKSDYLAHLLYLIKSGMHPIRTASIFDAR